MSFASREYEKAIKNADYNYQWSILSNEIRKLRERQRTIQRAEARAEKQGIDQIIIDVALQTEFQQNKKDIAVLQELREQTKKQVQAERKGIEIPKAKTYKAIHIFQRQSAKLEREKAEYPKASQRTLSAKIERSRQEAVETVIQRMFFSGKFLLSGNWGILGALEYRYSWVFDVLGFKLSDSFRSYIARNYADFGSDRAYDFFNEVIEDETSKKPKIKKEVDGVEYVDEEHTLEEYYEAINKIVKSLKP